MLYHKLSLKVGGYLYFTDTGIPGEWTSFPVSVYVYIIGYVVFFIMLNTYSVRPLKVQLIKPPGQKV